ncbi:MAG: Holliday junction resolvase RuvX [Myxococcales bacterium]|nr:Holliday junction resolvase RuvX [Myxococcales bacterium]MCB9542584.1 Holliday junction resolvase RuvX [Myxococcales bacterium]
MTRTFGLDVGTRTIGVAVSDPTATLASPLTTIRRTGLRQDLDALAALIAAHDVDRLVVGWPLQPDGREGPITRKVQAFADAAAARTGLPVEKWDERMTSKLAERYLIEGGARRETRRQVVDKVAAALILQGWLDARSRTENGCAG